MPTPTMKVRLKEGGTEMVINVSDFNPYLMEEIGDAHKGLPGGRGPTFEEFLQAGYKPELYPPTGFDWIPSKGYVEFLHARIKKMEAEKPQTDAGGSTTGTPGAGAGSPSTGGTGAGPSAPASSPAPSSPAPAPASTPAPGASPSKQ